MTSPLPPWLRRKLNDTQGSLGVKRLLRGHNLRTVCEEARCPNQRECFSSGTATFLIMGPLCTRSCGFCAIQARAAGPLGPLDPDEPDRVANAAAHLELDHVVVTSVTRDDLDDGGAGHFVAVVEAIHRALPEADVEVLTPDFLGREDCLVRVALSGAQVLNHNLETVRELQPLVRPQADYDRSLEVLRAYGRYAPEAITKSGLMVGLGETRDQVYRAVGDLIDVGCRCLTVGQYLRPRRANLPVERYWTPEEFAQLALRARELGMEQVEAAPLVRSSFMAKESKLRRKDDG